MKNNVLIKSLFQIPFSKETKDLILDKISDMNFVQDICEDMYGLFMVRI